MFHIGRAPKVPKRQRRDNRWNSKKNTYIQADIDSDIEFTTKPKSWLLLPERTLSYFERSMLRSNSADSFINPYLQSISFIRKYPENSIGYAFAKGAFPTQLSYTDINELIANTFLKNMRVRLCMKKLLCAWKTRHMKIVNDVDIVTQDPPKKPVLIVDWQTKTIYQFEASTILRDSFIRLMNHDLLILESQCPRNPFTNSDLTYGACLSIHSQLLKAGVTNWLWEAFADSNFNVNTLNKNFDVPMKLYCLDLVLREHTKYDTLEFVMDFIAGEYVHHNIINPPDDAVILGIIKRNWMRPSIRSWVALCRRFWRSKIRGEHVEKDIRIQSLRLIHQFKIVDDPIQCIYLNIS